MELESNFSCIAKKARVGYAPEATTWFHKSKKSERAKNEKAKRNSWRGWTKWRKERKRNRFKELLLLLLLLSLLLFYSICNWLFRLKCKWQQDSSALQDFQSTLAYWAVPCYGWFLLSFFPVFLFSKLYYTVIGITFMFHNLFNSLARIMAFALF